MMCTHNDLFNLESTGVAKLSCAFVSQSPTAFFCLLSIETNHLIIVIVYNMSVLCSFSPFYASTPILIPASSDMESCGDDGGICVKLAPNLLEPEILVKMAPGNRSQNFIDEVFRSAQSKCI